jgi:ABC-type iron transport system FetAB ATPase subunit
MVSRRIEVSGLGYAVGGVEILRSVDAAMPGGEITAVVGPSGVGKSNLLRAINRLIEPSSGEVYRDGEPTSALDPLELRRWVGMVFQIPAVFGDSVEEAVLCGARLSGKDADPGKRLAHERPRRGRAAQDRGSHQGSERPAGTHDGLRQPRPLPGGARRRPRRVDG